MQRGCRILQTSKGKQDDHMHNFPWERPMMSKILSTFHFLNVGRGIFLTFPGPVSSAGPP